MTEPNTTDHDTALDEYLERNEAALVSLAEELIGIDSQNPPGSTLEIVAFVERFAADLGLETERIVADEDRPNLLVSLPGRTETTLLYNGHLDTVPYDPDQWTYDPLGERDGDRLYGRGATDMKGAIAAMLHALRAYVETGTEPPVSIELALVSDEETAGPAGLAAVLERDRIDADACVIGETTCEADEHSVTVADKGSIWLTLTASGSAAHGSRPPLGENAIDRLFEAIADLRGWLAEYSFDLDDEIAPIVEESVSFYAPRMGEETAWQLFTRPTVNVGTFEGGGTINQVPDSARAEFDVRLTAGVHTPSILSELEAILEEHPGVEIADVSWSVGSYEPVDSPIVEATATTAEAVIQEPVYRRSATGGGDAKKLRNEGIPTVDFAFGTETAHAPDEYTTVDALRYNAEVYARLPHAFASNESSSEPKAPLEHRP